MVGKSLSCRLEILFEKKLPRDRCYDYIFAEKFSEKTGVFDWKQSEFKKKSQKIVIITSTPGYLRCPLYPFVCNPFVADAYRASKMIGSGIKDTCKCLRTGPKKYCHFHKIPKQTEIPSADETCCLPKIRLFSKYDKSKTDLSPIVEEAFSSPSPYYWVCIPPKPK
jgi:hypothetical protein